MKRKALHNLILAAVMAVAGGLAAAPAHASKDKPVIGFSIDDLRVERWTRDRDYFVAAAEKMGAKVYVQSADANEERQVAQIEADSLTPREILREKTRLQQEFGAQLEKYLTAEQLAHYPGPTYAMFELDFGVRMVRAEEKLRAVLPDAAQAEGLGVPPGTPLLSVERLAYTYNDVPMELRRGLYRTDTHHYHNELS